MTSTAANARFLNRIIETLRRTIIAYRQKSQGQVFPPREALFVGTASLHGKLIFDHSEGISEFPEKIPL